GCRFAPHVMAIMTGEPLEVTNADVVTHNTHPTPQQNRAWTETQPPGAQPVRQSFGAEEVAIPVKCNLHPWMKTYVAVLGSPYFQVTRADGTFDLSNVPPGTYTLVAWHELYGKREQVITINARQKQT